MSSNENRRPLKSRGSNAAQAIAKYLSSKNVTPNQISIFSVFFAAAAAIFMILPQFSDQVRWPFLLVSALLIQFRLLCNLFDGMVAVEGGKGTSSGELFNDMPDRFADAFILIAMGFAYTYNPYCEALGWTAALLAIMTAYTRVLTSSIGAPVNFCGPMAKQHRMALVTGACLLSCFETFFAPNGLIFFVVLIIVNIGSAITVFRRTSAAYKFLEKK